MQKAVHSLFIELYTEADLDHFMPISQGLDVRIQFNNIRMNLTDTKSRSGRKL